MNTHEIALELNKHWLDSVEKVKDDNNDIQIYAVCSCGEWIPVPLEPKYDPLPEVGDPVFAFSEHCAAAVAHYISCCEYACYEDPGCLCEGCIIIALRAALEKMTGLAAFLNDADDWFARDAGIDAEGEIAEARAALAKAKSVAM